MCLILAALPRRQQSAKNYCKFYDHYNINLIGEIFNAKPKELSGGECAWWSIEFNSQGWTREQIDAKIEDVLKGHNKEIGRIKKIGT
ncbi:MAG: hypothetical protein IIB56_03935 [Planctomycetes bacterium]|nr:hypothetical protein [Planctomycetota bacterium]